MILVMPLHHHLMNIAIPDRCAGKANTSHTHAISEITNLQTTLDSKLNLTGGALSGQVTTNQVSFTSSNQLVSKNYVDTRLPTDVDTPISYTIQNAE
ncbi:MAG: hypothetical protein EBT12_12380, partial [Marivivens sp.]|nr:hypothetical protein [Marivivens sp.]